VAWVLSKKQSIVHVKFSNSPHLDLISIDIGGEDLNVWKSITKFRSNVFVIEINSSIESFLTPNQSKLNSQTNFHHMVNYAKS
jgi:hypothetical protein